MVKKTNLSETFCSVIILILGGALCFQGCSFAQSAGSFSFPELEFTSRDRILILAPHPDDEVLGCGGVIQKAVAMRLPLSIVFLTYGDNNQWSFLVYRKHPVLLAKTVRAMGLVRYNEAISACQAMGVLKKNMIFLGYPDSGTLAIWYAHWGKHPAFKSTLTQARTVPYTNAFRPGAVYKGEEILQDLKTILREFKPTKVFVSHPADRHPDHRALYLFTRIALWDLEGEMKPALYPYLIHFKGWPKPRGYYPGHSLQAPQVLKEKILWKISTLKSHEVGLKDTAVKRHQSQYKSSRSQLLSFVRSNELFGDFPVIVLKPDGSCAVIPSEVGEDLTDIPYGLTEEERASFVGIGERSIFLEKNDLVLSTKLRRTLERGMGVSVYVFGYRNDRAFQDMPKLHIKLGAIDYKVLNQDKRLRPDVLTVKCRRKEITIRIPLAVLYNPQYVLISAQTYRGELPMDWASWRIVEIKDKGGQFLCGYTRDRLSAGFSHEPDYQ